MPAFGKRRALGQHFLRDTAIIDKIARTALEEATRAGCRALLEIGPGRGAITRPLLELLEAEVAPSIERMMLAEADRGLIAEWTEHAQERARQPGGGAKPPLVVEGGDFNELADERWTDIAPLAVASNLPYSAGTAILQKLARRPDVIPVMVLMFQAEVAHRLRAEIGTKAWGSLSIWIQNQWDVRKLCAAPPGAFAPPPDVDSEVVVLTRRKEPRVRVTDPAKWDALLKASFAHRRKMLRSGLPEGPMREALARSGVDPTLRAEALSWEQWQRFYESL
jgi:16S rRNA (adenine1518-N6/adenine1519-N6)-dimethyltransferase